MTTLASVPSQNWFTPIDNNEQDWLIPYAAVSGAIGVEVGDLMYDYGSSLDVAYPAGQQATGGSESADQATFAAAFIGCSIDKVLSTETNATRRLVVRTQGVKVFDCPSQAWAKGALVGIYSDGANSPVSQKVDSAADVSHAIGVVVKGTLGVSVTQVTVAFVARNYTGAKMGNPTGAATVSSLVSSASTFPINGQTAAQGGSVTVTGGTSNTSANAGGAVALVGGTPGATGVGGAVTITGAIGGATSGAGGAVTITGGAGTNGNAAGGAAALIGGLGQGSAAGGAITITSGAAGATGVAGAVNISVGAATAGAGSAVTITGGNGAGGTAAGGNINLVPGTAVSTGIPGELKVNSVAGTCEVTYTSPLMTTVVPATGTAQPFYVATRAMRVKKAYCSEVTHGTSETIDIIKDPTGGAVGAGTSVLTAPMDPHAASNTPVAGTVVATIATVTLAAGDRLSFLTGGTIGAAAGLTITVLLVPC